MTTISVQLLNDDALGLLRELERLQLLKLFLPATSKKAVVRAKTRSGTAAADRPGIQPEKEFKAGFGGAKGMFVMSPDFDEPLELLNPVKPGIRGWGVPIGDLAKYKPGFGGAAGMISMSPDFDEPLEDLHEYMY